MKWSSDDFFLQKLVISLLVIQSVSMINFQMNGDFAVHTGEVREARYEISKMPHIENGGANFFLAAQRLIFLPPESKCGERTRTDGFEDF